MPVLLKKARLPHCLYAKSEAAEPSSKELAKCFLLEFGDNREFSYGRCDRQKSFNDLYDGLKGIE